MLFCAAAIASVAMATSPAKAVEWPWCAILTDRHGTATNCGFASYQQCSAYISGIGGYCTHNPRFQGDRRRR
jgi:hypothetical protein